MMSSLLSASVQAQDAVASVAPLNGSHNAAVSTGVLATLCGAGTSGLSSRTFVLHGSQTPSGANTTSGAGTTTININPFNDFKPGELVQATVTNGVQTVLGGVTPYVWKFRTEVAAGNGVFSLSSIALEVQIALA